MQYERQFLPPCPPLKRTEGAAAPPTPSIGIPLLTYMHAVQMRMNSHLISTYSLIRQKLVQLVTSEDFYLYLVKFGKNFLVLTPHITKHVLASFN